MNILTQNELKILYDGFIKESVKRSLPVQNDISEIQLDRIWHIMNAVELEYFGEVQYKEIFQKIGYIIYAINKSHILMDGNKRISLILALFLLDINGIEHSKMCKSDWEMLIMRVASDSYFFDDNAKDYLKEKLE